MERNRNKRKVGILAAGYLPWIYLHLRHSLLYRSSRPTLQFLHPRIALHVSNPGTRSETPSCMSDVTLPENPTKETTKANSHNQQRKIRIKTKEIWEIIRDTLTA